jgi:hypothetical protein
MSTMKWLQLQQVSQKTGMIQQSIWTQQSTFKIQDRKMDGGQSFKLGELLTEVGAQFGANANWQSWDA